MKRKLEIDLYPRGKSKGRQNVFKITYGSRETIGTYLKRDMMRFAQKIAKALYSS